MRENKYLKLPQMSVILQLGSNTHQFFDLIHFSMFVKNRDLWQLKLDIFMHWYLVCAVQLVSSVKVLIHVT
jgi:hypothetical protein